MALLTGWSARAGAEDDWTLARDKEDIKVYTRPNAEYKYKEYKGVTVMDGTAEKLVEILKDPKTYHLWAYNCVENTAKVLKAAESRGEYYIYMEIKAPLVSNRDVISYYKFHPPAADGSVLIEFTGVPDFIPEKKGLVRIPAMKGFWKITPLGNGKIKVVHQAFSHPGGNPPAGLVNSSTIAAPFHMLKEVQALMR